MKSTFFTSQDFIVINSSPYGERNLKVPSILQKYRDWHVCLFDINKT